MRKTVTKWRLYARTHRKNPHTSIQILKQWPINATERNMLNFVNTLDQIALFFATQFLSFVKWMCKYSMNDTRFPCRVERKKPRFFLENTPFLVSELRLNWEIFGNFKWSFCSPLYEDKKFHTNCYARTYWVTKDNQLLVTPPNEQKSR